MKTALLALALAFQTFPSAAPGTVTGEVRDPDSAVVPGAMVVMTRLGVNADRTQAATDATGRFQLSLSEGSYDLIVTRPGFRTAKSQIKVEPGKTFLANINLQVGRYVEVITVRGGFGGPLAAEEQEPGVVRVGGNIIEPRKLTHVLPSYPDAAANAGQGGLVVMEAVLGADGLVKNPKILQGAPLLDAAVLAAARQWQYSPAQLNKRPIEIELTVSVNFVAR